MNNFLLSLPSIAHLFIGFYFVFFGFWNVYHWRPLMNAMLGDKITSPMLFLSVGILWQTVFGFMIIFGIFVEISALLLIPYVIIAILIRHPFWKFHGENRGLHFTIFLTHLLITISALLLLCSYPTNLNSIT